jgi:hypothetical protein
VAPGIRKAFFRELAAHPSTQHANKMFVKLGAMFGKNKTRYGLVSLLLSAMAFFSLAMMVTRRQTKT